MLSIIILSSCGKGNDKNHNDSKNLDSKYLFLDNTGVLHTNLDCEVLKSTRNDKTELNSIEFLDTNEILTPYKYCMNCVTPIQYEHLKSLILKNREKLDLHEYNYVEEIRKSAIASGYQDIGDSACFRKIMKDPNFRRSLYDALSEDVDFKNEYGDIGSFEVYERNMQLDLFYDKRRFTDLSHH